MSTERAQIQIRDTRVLVLGNIRELGVIRLTIAITNTARVMEHATTIMTLTFVAVTMVTLGKTVKQWTIAITRTVLITEHVITNKVLTNAHVTRGILGRTANTHTVRIINVNIIPRVSMDPLTTHVNVDQDTRIIYVKQGISVIIRNAQGMVHVKMKHLAIHVVVMQNI